MAQVVAVDMRPANGIPQYIDAEEAVEEEQLPAEGMSSATCPIEGRSTSVATCSRHATPRCRKEMRETHPPLDHRQHPPIFAWSSGCGACRGSDYTLRTLVVID